VFLPGGLKGGPLGCCAAGVGFDDASGWGSVNVAAFEQAAAVAEPPTLHIALSVAGRQRAIRARSIKATVSCSAACLLSGYALVKVGHHGHAYEFDGRVESLKAAGSDELTIKLSSKELRRLQAGRRKHSALTATVYGVLINSTVYDVIHAAGESVQSQTAGKRVKLS
jgi:hypothetical protein